jgi:Putative zinc-finger
MTEQRPPHSPVEGHPDEALAAFTDGTATADERALVLAHLQGCVACRRDVETARRALDALAGLPEPEAPTLDPESIVRRAGNVLEIEAAGGRRRGLARLGSGAVLGGLATGLVAAGIAFVLATGAIKLGGGGASTAASSAAGGQNPAPAESGGFALRTVPTDFSRDSIDRLAADEASAAGGKNPAPLPTAGSKHAAVALVPAAERCTSAQTTDGSRPTTVVLARFEGRPVFVAVLRGAAGGEGFVRVVVTDRTTCSVLYSARASVPHG